MQRRSNQNNNPSERSSEVSTRPQNKQPQNEDTDIEGAHSQDTTTSAKASTRDQAPNRNIQPYLADREQGPDPGQGQRQEQSIMAPSIAPTLGMFSLPLLTKLTHLRCRRTRSNNQSLGPQCVSFRASDA